MILRGALGTLEDLPADNDFLQAGLKVPAVGDRNAGPHAERHLADASYGHVDVRAVLAAQPPKAPIRVRRPCMSCKSSLY